MAVRGRDPENELRTLNRRFRKVSRRYERAIAVRRLYRWAATLAVAASVAIAIYWGLTVFSPWPPEALLKHLAAFPDCDAARAVGLAPADKGDPGYWQRHDEDGDGVACEFY